MSRRRQVESTEEKASDRLHIRLAQRRLQGTAVHAPLVLCPRSGIERLLYFKPESFQPKEPALLRAWR
jgi:hypothetical protein